MAGATGTSVWQPSAAMIRCSRPMSCAVGSTWPVGGRRRAHAWPAESTTLYVRLERPPAINSNVSGGSTPGTCSVNHPVTGAGSMPSICSMVSHGSGLGMALTGSGVDTVTMDVSDATFEQQVLDRSVDVPVVVDLWAEWCGPCRTLGPTLERVIEATNGRVELAKVNVDENPQISATFQVQSIPA